MADEDRSPEDVINSLTLNPVAGDWRPGPPEQKVARLLQKHVEVNGREGEPLAPDEWDRVAGNLQQHFPGIDPSGLRKPYEQERQLQYHREQAKTGEEATSSFLLRHSAPFGATNRQMRLAQNYQQAVGRFKANEASEQDYKDIAAYERLQQLDADPSLGSQLKIGLAGIPAVVGEVAMGSKGLGVASKVPGLRWLAPAAEGAGATARAGTLSALAGATGRTAALTALAPSMYLGGAQQRAAEQGGEVTDLKNLAPAFALGALNTAVLGSLGKAASGIEGAGLGPALKRIGAKTGLGLAEQQAVDVLAGATGLQTGYGVMGDLLRDDAQGALKHATVQAVTFAAFAALHGRDPEKVMAPVQEALAKMKARGMSAEGAGAAIAPVYKTLNDALNENPNLSPAEARKLADAIPDKVTQKLGRDLADQLPEPKNGTSPISAPAESPKATDQPGPQPSEETAGLPPDQFEAEVQRLMRGGRSRAAAKETLAEKAADAGMPEEEMQAEIDRMMGKKPRPAETAPPEPEPPKEAEPFEDLSADQLRQLSKQVAGRTLRTAAGLRKALREQGLSEKTMSDLSAATAKPAVPEKAPGVPQEAPASQTAPDAQTPPEQPQATPESPPDEVDPATKAFHQTFPGMEVTPSGQLRATVGEGESARHVYLSEGESGPNAVRLDFTWADSERFGKGKALQPGSVELMRNLVGLLGKLKEAGVPVEYTAVGGREAVYKRMLERSGFELVSGPAGPGNGLRVWTPKAERPAGAGFASYGRRAEALEVARASPDAKLEELYDAAGLTPRERHVIHERVQQGRTHDDIAGDPEMRGPDGGRLTRQRLQQIDRDAMRKLGASGTTQKAVLRQEAVDRAVQAVEDGGRTLPSDLHLDPKETRRAVGDRLDYLESEDRRRDQLVAQYEKELKDAGGRLPPEREQFYVDALSGRRGGAQGGRPGEAATPQELSGVPGGADRPAPVRPEGRGEVPERAAPAEAGPADQGGQPGAPVVEGAERPGAAPEPAQRGPAGGNQLRKSAADIAQEDAEGKLSRANGTPFYHEDMPPQERIDRAKAAILEEMRRPEKDRRTDGAIIAKVREKVDSTRREFDEALRQLRREKKLRLIAAGDLSEYTETELNRSLAGENETFVQAELSGESPGLTAGERLRRGRAVPRAFEAEARQLGVDPEDLPGRAREIKSADAAAVEEHNAFLREARSWLGNKGRRLADDPANVKGLDEAADAMARRHPGFFQGDEKPTDALYRLLRAGNQKPMSEADAYQQALTHLADLKAHAAATPEELADVNRRLEADGQPRATQADIGGLQEAAHRAAVAAPGGAAGEGPVGSAPAETDFDFGANEPGQRVAGTSPTRVPQPDPLADLARDFAAEESGAQPLLMIPAYQRAYDLVKKAVTFTRDAVGRIGGAMFPTATRLNRPTGEAMADALGAPVAADEMARHYTDKVLGDKSSPEFDKLVGATSLEMRFRYSIQARRNESARASYEAHLARQQGDKARAAEMAKRASDLLNKANATATLVGGQNSPFKTEADFRAAAADPDVKAALARYEKYYVPEKEKTYRMSQGLDEADPIDSLTQRPGHPVLALALTPEEAATDSTVYAGARNMGGPGQGSLQNLKLRRNPSSVEASLSAGAYETDMRKIMEKDITRSYPIATRAEAARTAVEQGMARWGKPGEQIDGYKAVPFTKPPRGTQENAPGQDTLYVKDDIHEEWVKAMKVGTPEAYKQVLGALNTAPTIAALSSSVEAASHSVNLLSALLTKPSGAWDGGFTDFMKNLWQRFAPKSLGGDRGQFQERIMELARINAVKPRGPETGTIVGAAKSATQALTGKVLPESLKYFDPTYYAGRVLDVMSDVVRLTLGDWFDRQAKLGRVEGTATNKRDFINQSTGQYMKGAQNGMIAWLRETKFGPFATAASTFTSEGVKSLGLGTNLKSTGLKAEVAMRAEVFAKMATVLGAAAVYNMAKWGRPDGDDQTPLFALKVGQENGKNVSLDLSPLVRVKRGLRAVGLLGYVEGKRQGKDEGQAEDKGVQGIALSLMHPFMGPAPTFAYEAYTGENVFGHRIAPEVSKATTARGFNAAARKGMPLPGSSQRLENMKAAFLNANPAVSALTGADEPTRDVPVNERLAKLLGPYGFKYRDAAERKRKGLR